METKTTIIPPEALERQAALCGEIQEYWQAQGVTPVAFVDTYGCQQNEADSERIRGMLRECGYRMSDTEEGATASSSTPAPSASTPRRASTATSARWSIRKTAIRRRKFSSAAA